MNYGIPDVPWLGTDAIYNIVPGLNPNASQATWIEARLQELHLYMTERHVQFVPNLHSPDGNSLFDPRMVEGTWVRNASFTFDTASGRAVPTVAPTTASQLNGDFTALGSDGRPQGWTFTNSTPGARSPSITTGIHHVLADPVLHASEQAVDHRLDFSSVEQRIWAISEVRDGVGAMLAQKRCPVGEQPGGPQGSVPGSLPGRSSNNATAVGHRRLCRADYSMGKDE